MVFSIKGWYCTNYYNRYWCKPSAKVAIMGICEAAKKKEARHCTVVSSIQYLIVHYSSNRKG